MRVGRRLAWRLLPYKGERAVGHGFPRSVGRDRSPPRPCARRNPPPVADRCGRAGWHAGLARDGRGGCAGTEHAERHSERPELHPATRGFPDSGASVTCRRDGGTPTRWSRPLPRARPPRPARRIPFRPRWPPRERPVPLARRSGAVLRSAAGDCRAPPARSWREWPSTSRPSRLWPASRGPRGGRRGRS